MTIYDRTAFFLFIFQRNLKLSEIWIIAGIFFGFRNQSNYNIWTKFNDRTRYNNNENEIKQPKHRSRRKSVCMMISVFLFIFHLFGVTGPYYTYIRKKNEAKCYLRVVIGDRVAILENRLLKYLFDIQVHFDSFYYMKEIIYLLKCDWYLLRTLFYKYILIIDLLMQTDCKINQMWKNYKAADTEK